MRFEFSNTGAFLYIRIQFILFVITINKEQVDYGI
jgi:hypothetical protein